MHQVELDADDRRVLKLYARRVGGTLVDIRPLNGGLSGSRVLHLSVESPGGHRATVVAKIDDLVRTQSERHRVETLVTGALGPGAFPALACVVESGAGATGGLFFSGRRIRRFTSRRAFPRSAWRCCCCHIDSGTPGSVIANAPLVQTTVEGIRTILSDKEPTEQQSAAISPEIEAQALQMRRAIQHCDLHVFNVLVSATNEPMIIDFARTSEGPASLDAVTLELSVLLHGAEHDVGGAWPTIEAARKWAELDSYIEDCPYSDFVHACREWAFASGAGSREVWACAYSYCIRQLRFETCPPELAMALVEGVSERLME